MRHALLPALTLLLTLAAALPAQHLLSAPQRLDADIVQVADFDGDGDLDLLRRNTGLALQGTVTVMLNDGQGKFTDGPQTPLVVSTTVVAATGDFDGDGLADIAAFAPGSPAPFGHGVFVYPSLGGGNFGPPQFIGLEGNVGHLHAADVNGDGFSDLVVINAVPNSGDRRLRWLTSNFGNSFDVGAGLPLPQIGAPFDIIVLDVNDDGVPDVVGTDSPAAIVLYPTVAGEPTQGAFVPLTNDPFALVRISSGDFDGDGREDVFAVTNSVAGVQGAVVRNMGTGPWTAAPVQLFPDVGLGVAVHGDWDGDGDVDTFIRAASDFNGDYSLLANDGQGDFSVAFRRPTEGVAGPAIALVDLNQDGHTDFIGGNDLWFGTSEVRDPAAPLGLTNLRTTDFDDDGDLDVVGPQGQVALNNGAGDFEIEALGLPTPPGDFFYGADVTVHDFDADGIPDYLVRYLEATGFFMPPNFIEMRILRGTVQGAFVDAGPVASPGVDLNYPDPRYVPFVDIDGDGDGDLLTDDGIWESTTPGQFADPVDAFPAWRPIDGADFDGDGDTDVFAVSKASPFQVAVLRQGPAGVFTPEVISTAAGLSNEPQQNRPVMADLDDDGDLDLIYDDGVFGTTQIQIAENLGASFAAPFVLPSTASGSTAIQVADIDGDGQSDLIVGDGTFSGPSFYVYLRTTGLNFAPERAYLGGGLEVARDFDHDGDVDLLGGALTRNREHFGLAGGGTRQYGAGSAGSGGLVPLLSAVGPFRVGEVTEVRLRHAVGGATAILLAGPAEAELIGVPFPGSNLLVSPVTEFFYLPLTGLFGAAGEGSFDVLYTVPPFFAGVPLYLQVGILDIGGVAPLTMSNGLEVRFGF